MYFTLIKILTFCIWPQITFRQHVNVLAVVVVCCKMPEFLLQKGHFGGSKLYCVPSTARHMHDLSRSANAVSAGNHKFFLRPLI